MRLGDYRNNNSVKIGNKNDMEIFHILLVSLRCPRRSSQTKHGIEGLNISLRRFCK